LALYCEYRKFKDNKAKQLQYKDAICSPPEELKEKLYEFTTAKVLEPHNMFTPIPKLKSETYI
jgi:hypothetical protein